MNSIQSIAVYCGARTGNNPIFAKNAYALGTLLARKNISLVYGGGNVGMMKMVADGCLDHEGNVIGVIPHKLKELELAHPRVETMYTTQSMQERKMMMAQLADAFIAMPGGFGTMEELFEVLTLTQLNYHNKPVGILNIEGYYDHLQNWVKQAHQKGFISANHCSLLKFESTPEAIMESLYQYEFYALHNELDES